MTIREFIAIGLAIVLLAQQTDDVYINVDTLVRLPHPAFSQAKVDAFLERTVSTEDQMRERIERVVRIPGFEIHEYNPLVELPIIRDSQSRLLLPIPRYLIDRVTDSLFYDLAEIGGQSFLTYFGKAFEQYVGQLFAHHHDLEVNPEREYGPKKARVRTTDWVVGGGAKAALLECKTKRLQVGSKLWQRQRQLADDLRLGAIKGVQQLKSTAIAIEEGIVFEEYHDRRLLPLVVLLDSCFLFNADPVKSIIASETGVDPDEFTYQVASVDEVEDLAVLDSESVLRTLAEKMDSAEARQNDLSTAVRPQLTADAIHPLLDQAKGEFMAWLGSNLDIPLNNPNLPPNDR